MTSNLLLAHHVAQSTSPPVNTITSKWQGGHVPSCSPQSACPPSEPAQPHSFPAASPTPPPHPTTPTRQPAPIHIKLIRDLHTQRKEHLMHNRLPEAHPLAAQRPANRHQSRNALLLEPRRHAIFPMPRCHAVDERPERLVLEQLHGVRDDARVDEAAEYGGVGVGDQVEDEEAVVDDGGVMVGALKASLGRTLLALR